MPLFAGPTLLHNPKCSKSRAAKALLDERGVAYTERRYLEDPLSPDELAELTRRLGRPVRGWTRTAEPAFREADLTGDSSDPEILSAMARFPILIERPILIMGSRAAVGRPLDDLAALLDGGR